MKARVFFLFMCACFGAHVCAKKPPVEHKKESVIQKKYFKAINEGKKGSVEKMLKNGFDVEAVNRFGDTGLHVAAMNGDKKMVKVLLEYKADVNAQNPLGFTPLISAILSGKDSDDHCDVICYLLKHDARLDIPDKQGAYATDFIQWTESENIGKKINEYMSRSKA